MNAADHRNVSALKTYTVWTLATARSNPPSAGPAKKPTLSMTLDATFAAVSSPGSPARTGSRAACAGRKAVPTSAVAIASAYTSREGPPAAITPAAANTSAARMQSAESITRLREYRSASTDAKGSAIAIVR